MEIRVNRQPRRERLGGVKFGEVVAYDMRYYILSYITPPAGGDMVTLINLDDGTSWVAKPDTLVHVIKNVVLTGEI